MNKKKLLTTSLVALMALMGSGCQSNSTSSVNSSNQITSVDSEEISTVTSMLKEMRKGFSIKGEVNQLCTYLDGLHGAPNGESATNKYSLDITYQNGNEVGFQALITDQNGKVKYDNTCLEDSEGYAYTYELNYDNTAEKIYLEDSNGYKVNYGYYCTNPFSMIIEEDLKRIDDNTYELSKSKAAMFAGNVLSVVDSAFYEVIKTCEIKVENGKFTQMKIIPAQVEDYFTDYETYENHYYLLDNEAILNFEDVGVAKLDIPSPRAHNDSHDALQKALDKLDDNYTMCIKFEPYTNNIREAVNYYNFYFDGKSIYFQIGNGDEPSDADLVMYDFDGGEALSPIVYDRASQKWSEEAAHNYSQLQGYTYDFLKPIISGVKAEIFDYDSKNEVYNACDEIVSYIGVICLVPVMAALGIYLDGYGTACSISLTQSGNIDQIYLSYQMDYSSFVMSGDITIQINDIDSTVLPFDVDHNIA